MEAEDDLVKQQVSKAAAPRRKTRSSSRESLDGL